MGQPFSVGEEITLTTLRMASGGHGAVARHDGFVFFVEFAAPNETLKCEIVRIKKNFGVAKILDILEPSESRRAAPCTAFGKCGGCQWQHIEYSEQLIQKHNIVTSTLSTHITDSTNVLDIASADEWNYRNRIQLHKRKGRMGFLRKGSHELVDIDRCHIADNQINEYFAELRSKEFDRLEVFIDSKKNSVTSREESPGDHHYFSQVNNQVNQIMKNDLMNALTQPQPEEGGPLLDLYCGQGNITFPLAQKFVDSPIIGVELSKSSIQSAKTISSELGITNTNFFAADVADYLADASFETKPELVVVDPPRSGCDKSVIEHIKRLGPSTFAYISCHPATLDRDLKLLGEGYQLISLRAYDMFPQTDHIECMAILLKV